MKTQSDSFNYFVVHPLVSLLSPQRSLTVMGDMPYYDKYGSMLMQVFKSLLDFKFFTTSYRRLCHSDVFFQNGVSPTLVTIQDTEGAVFGALVSHPIRLFQECLTVIVIGWQASLCCNSCFSSSILLYALHKVTFSRSD